MFILQSNSLEIEFLIKSNFMPICTDHLRMCKLDLRIIRMCTYILLLFLTSQRGLSHTCSHYPTLVATCRALSIAAANVAHERSFFQHPEAPSCFRRDCYLHILWCAACCNKTWSSHSAPVVHRKTVSTSALRSSSWSTRQHRTSTLYCGLISLLNTSHHGVKRSGTEKE
jgi:hypothetical protein